MEADTTAPGAIWIVQKVYVFAIPGVLSAALCWLTNNTFPSHSDIADLSVVGEQIQPEVSTTPMWAYEEKCSFYDDEERKKLGLSGVVGVGMFRSVRKQSQFSRIALSFFVS